MKRVFGGSWRRWEAYWFPESTGLDLAVCRIAITAFHLVFFFPSLGLQLDQVRYYDDFQSPQPLIALLAGLVSPEILRSAATLTAIHWMTWIAGLLVVIGLRTRTAASLFALGLLFLYSHQWSYGERKPVEAVTLIFFLLLPLAPCGLRLSWDARLRRERSDAPERPDTSRLAAWVPRLTALLLALVYFNAAYWKLSNGGFEWLNGHRVQLMNLERALLVDVPIALWMARQHWLCVAISYATVAFELLFVSGLLFRRTLPVWLVLGVFFHLGIYFVRAGNPQILAWPILYLTFIDFERRFASPGRRAAGA